MCWLVREGIYFQFWFLTIETGTCIEWAVRVADGLVLGDGFVEICRNNVWTTVDSSQWDYSEAMVTCRNQGYNDTCKLHL